VSHLQRFSALILCASAGFTTLPAHAVPLVGATYGGDGSSTLFDLDHFTGLASNPRPGGPSHVVGLAFSPGLGAFALTSSAAAVYPASLFRIDIDNGTPHWVGFTGLGGISEGDLAFDPTSGSLYGLYGTSAGQRRLLHIDPATGTAAPFGSSLPGDPSAMAFDAAGELYVLDTSLQNLLRVDKATAAVLEITPLSASLGSTAGMAFDPSAGTLYVADGEDGCTGLLYRLSTTTGELLPVGATGLSGGFSSLTWIPEPGSALLLCLGAMALLRRQC